VNQYLLNQTIASETKDKRSFKALGAVGGGHINAFNERFRHGKGIDALFAEYLALGGGHSSVHSADADLTKKVRKKLTNTRAQAVLDTYKPCKLGDIHQ